jgi:xanthine dehydrogenase small subunit
MPLTDFYTGYMANQLRPGEFVRSLVVPLPQAGQVLRAYKISKRFDSDISALCGAFVLDLQDGIVRAGAAGLRRRGRHRQARCRGRSRAGRPALDRWHAGRRVMAALASDFQPLSTCAPAPTTGCRWRRTC